MSSTPASSGTSPVLALRQAGPVRLLRAFPQMPFLVHVAVRARVFDAGLIPMRLDVPAALAAVLARVAEHWGAHVNHAGFAKGVSRDVLCTRGIARRRTCGCGCRAVRQGEDGHTEDRDAVALETKASALIVRWKGVQKTTMSSTAGTSSPYAASAGVACARLGHCWCQWDSVPPPAILQ
jgi:hypothetical protein